MFFNSYRNKSGLTGGNVKDGFLVGHNVEYKDNLTKKWMHVGASDAVGQRVRGGDAGEIDKLSGYKIRAFKPDNNVLDEPVPMEFGGRTYMVGNDGIKLVNEKFLDELVTENIERENYITDVCSLFLYAGNKAVQVVSRQLFDALSVADIDTANGRVNCLPSTIRTTTDTALYGKLYLEMKERVSHFIDTVVIPESVLEKARNVKRNDIDAKQVRTVEGE